MAREYVVEWRTGIPVRDNTESRTDPVFQNLQAEKSTEGLSESVVQFMVQLTFLGFFIWAVHHDVFKFFKNLSIIRFFAQNKLGAFMSLGGVDQTQFLYKWGKCNSF